MEEVLKIITKYEEKWRCKKMEQETTENKQVETKICKHCQSEIPKKAKVCPNCRKKQGGKAKWIVIAVLVIAVIGTALGGNDAEDATKTGEVTAKTESKGGDTDSKEETTEAASEEVDNTFKVGDVVETSDLKITYISAEEYQSDSQVIQPKDGYVYYRMEFEFENIGNVDQTVSSVASWDCYADGYAMDAQYFGDDAIDATMSPGKKAAGAVYYEVPKDAKEITLEYETNFLSQNKIVFVVK